jgi:hypothetical protein
MRGLQWGRVGAIVLGVVGATLLELLSNRLLDWRVAETPNGAIWLIALVRLFNIMMAAGIIFTPLSGSAIEERPSAVQFSPRWRIFYLRAAA